VDGAYGQCGTLNGQMAVQAKGVTYPVNRLLGDDALGERFRDGTFATFYLCPADYHHIHSPIAGEVIKAIHIPGGLLPVFKESTEVHTDLFVRNERLISLLKTEVGLVAVVKIGATSVGKITLAYDGDFVTNRKKCRDTIKKDYAAGEHPVAKGQELGVFNLGSTVVLLFEKGRVSLDGEAIGTAIKYGQKVGNLAN
jgi:phosphatidylserine decarboxylase